MAGTATLNEETLSSIKKIVWSWTSSTGGTVDKTTTKAYTGQLLGLMTVPGTGAGATPTDNYDITIKDQNDTDQLRGAGADRDDTNTEWVTANLGIVANDTLALQVTNAGNAKNGVTYLYLR
jgi:hypothetical protein